MQGGKNRKNFFLKTLVYVPAMVLKTTTTQVNRKVGNSTPPSALHWITRGLLPPCKIKSRYDYDYPFPQICENAHKLINLGDSASF